MAISEQKKRQRDCLRSALPLSIGTLGVIFHIKGETMCLKAFCGYAGTLKCST